MDMSKYIKKKNLWIFDDTFPTEKVGLFIDGKFWKTNSGKDSEVFVFGIDGSDYMIMPFKVDYTDFVEKFGASTDDWKGHQFVLSKNEKGKYRILCIEEDIQDTVKTKINQYKV
jgi:hypothetical protein